MGKSVGTRASRNQAATTQKATKPKRHQAPARSVERRESQLVSLATSLAEKQLRDGTASSQVITHYLKLATTNAALEREKLVNENKLLQAKAEALKSAKHSEELFNEAMRAFGIYSGKAPQQGEEDAED